MKNNNLNILKKEPNDIFYTPFNLAKNLLKHIDFEENDTLMDGFKGKGAFFDNFPSHLEKEWAEIEKGIDFFEIKKDFSWIISNPPFSKLDAIFDKTMLHSKIGFAYILPLLSLTYSRLRKIESFGFSIHKIVFFDNPKEWKIGFPHAFFIFKLNTKSNFKLLFDEKTIQKRLI